MYHCRMETKAFSEREHAREDLAHRHDVGVASNGRARLIMMAKAIVTGSYALLLIGSCCIILLIGAMLIA